MHRRTLLAASALSVGTVLLGAGCGGGSRDWAGTRLGMSTNDVRDRFHPGGAGTWTSAQEPEPVLRWTASSDDAPLKRAVFEFHQGMLVALTLVGGPHAAGRELETTSASVAARRKGPDGPEVRIISRGCETHRAEVARLLSAP